MHGLRGEGQQLRFRLDEVTLEFGVELTREGGINIWVVSVGAKGGLSSAHTNTVTVLMVPEVKSGLEWVDVRVAAEATGGRPPASGRPPLSSAPSSRYAYKSASVLPPSLPRRLSHSCHSQ